MMMLWPSPLVGIIAATVANFFAGMLWFSPLLFGNMFVKASGKTEKDCVPTAGMFIKSLVQGYIQVVALYGLSTIAQFVTIHDCLILAGWVSLLIAAGVYSQVLWENKSHSMFLLIAGHCVFDTFLAFIILFYARSWGM